MASPVWRPSPNFGARRGGATPDLIVLHYTAMVSTEAALDRLCDPAAEVSAHYLIDPAGAVIAMVDEADRAWHAGAGAWGPVSDVNSRSIGIELCNSGATPFRARQMDALEALLADIAARHAIAPERVIAHSDLAPGRKSDPGARFDWRRLARRGLSVWPADAGPSDAAPPVDTGAFRADAARFGYPEGVGDADILAAFRLRFRPHAAGPLGETDMAMISRLARRYPVDPAGPGA